jgi:hypothetical protein
MRAKATRVVRLYFASRLVFVCIVLSPLSGFPVDRSSTCTYPGTKVVRGLAENVTGFDIQRDLTAHQDVRTRCPCTHSKAIGHYYSREARKP